MAARGPIESVAVAGGGIVGWSAAAAIKRHLPRLRVTVVAVPPPPEALAERVGSTLPSIVGFHGDLGLSELDTVARTGSGYRLGTRFEGWAAERPLYVHSYAPHGSAFGATPFHLHWIRAARRGVGESFDSYSPAAALGRANRFVHPRGGESPLAGFEYGLQLNLPRYLAMMRAFARHLGVEERGDDISGVRLRAADGFIEAVRLGDESDIRADLFVDCTGPVAAIRSALDSRFEDWSRWLPCDRILFAEAPPPADPPVLDTVTATAAGWHWQAASPARTSRGFVYASGRQGDDEAQRLLESAEDPVRISQGRRREPWLRNCVAIGDAAVAVEPLEWTNLHLAHSAIDRIVAMLPEKDCAPIELAEYNRQAEAEADRVRDFLVLHYAAGRRGEPFWDDVAAVAPPASLEHTLSLFRERGRLPFYEEETFSRDSWLAVLLGQGQVPQRVDPLTDLVPPESAEAAMARMHGALASLPASLPSHSAYLRTLAARAIK